MIDTFTKLVRIYPVKRGTRLIATQKLLEQYIPQNEQVKQVQADRGSLFKSSKWAQTLTQAGIIPIMSAIIHSRGNMVERTNKEIGRCLRILLRSKQCE